MPQLTLVLPLVVGILFFNDTAKAELNMELAAGVNGNQQSTLVLVGLSRDSGTFFGIPTYQEFDLGGWAGEYQSSVVGIAQGVRGRFGATSLELSTGGSYVSETSDRLSTQFEFYEQVVLRRSVAGAQYAVSYRHWSNAGIRRPNRGMDFIGLVVAQHWK